MTKITITNRHKEDLVVVTEDQPNAKGLVFVMHGFGGFKEQDQIRIMADTFLSAGYSVVTFDTTDSAGESGGSISKASATKNYQDLEDVIKWAGEQSWYQEPFIMAGHSLAGLCILLYTIKYQDKVKAIAPISTVISGRHLLNSPDINRIKGAWEETKWYITESNSKPGFIKKIPWSFMIDMQKYNVLDNADEIKIPVLMAVGEHDPTTTIDNQKLLYNKLSAKDKELHVIKGAYHTFRKPEHLEALRKFFETWINKL